MAKYDINLLVGLDYKQSLSKLVSDVRKAGSRIGTGAVSPTQFKQLASSANDFNKSISKTIAKNLLTGGKLYL